MVQAISGATLAAGGFCEGVGHILRHTGVASFTTVLLGEGFGDFETSDQHTSLSMVSVSMSSVARIVCIAVLSVRGVVAVPLQRAFFALGVCT